MKKLLQGIIILMLCLVPLFVAEAEIDASWHEVSAGSAHFLYSDSLLMTSPNQLDGDLAKISAALSTVAYSEGSVTSALSQMGCESSHIMTDYSTYSMADPHHVAYAIGHKVSGEYNIYFVAVRGTHTAYEWESNSVFTSDNGYHRGFYEAETSVMNALNSEMNKYGRSNCIFLITGHSRGAAVANIMAGLLTANGAGRVFGYTFACPNVYYGSAPSYGNIYNFNFENDFVPRVPPASWGFSRYGIDKSKNAQNIVSDVYTKSEINDIVDAFTVASMGTLHQQLIFTMFSWGMAGGKSADFETFLSTIVDDASVYKSIFFKGAGIITDSLINNFLSMLDFWDNHSQEMLAITTTQAWENYRKADENKDFFALFDDFAGEKVTSYEQLETLIPLIRKSYVATGNIGSITSTLNLFFDFGYNMVPKLKSEFKKIGNAHAIGNYLIWMNKTYYGYEGYKGEKNLTGTLDIGVKTISPKCFSGATGTFVLKLDNVQAFGNDAFSNCEGLAELDISDPSKFFSPNAFKNFIGLQELKIAADHKYVFSETFTGCTSLKKITYTAGESGIMADRKSDSKPPEYDARKSLETIEFEEGVVHITTYIGGTANYSSDESNYMTALTSIVLPSTLESIGDYAFRCCTNLSEFALPENLVSIGVYAFSQCIGPEELNVPDSMTTIGQSAFYNCDGITRLNILNSNVTIAAYAFSDCDGITELVIPDTVVSIGWQAFSNCKGLQSIKVRADHGYIFNETFTGCMSLKKITYTAGESGIMADRKSDSKPPEYDARKSLETIEFEEGVVHITTYIGGTANYSSDESNYMTALTSIVLPSTLESIGACAFRYCSNLSQVSLPSGLKSIGNYAIPNATIIRCYHYIYADSWAQKNNYTINYLGTDSTMVLPAALTDVEEEAFYGNSVQVVIVNNGAQQIGPRAFAYCKDLNVIVLPDSITLIADDAFAGCGKIVIVCGQDSYAAQYAAEHHLRTYSE